MGVGVGSSPPLATLYLRFWAAEINSERPAPHHDKAAVTHDGGDSGGQQHQQEADDDRRRNGGERRFDEEQHQADERDAKVDDDDAPLLSSQTPDLVEKLTLHPLSSLAQYRAFVSGAFSDDEIVRLHSRTGGRMRAVLCDGHETTRDPPEAFVLARLAAMQTFRAQFDPFDTVKVQESVVDMWLAEWVQTHPYDGGCPSVRELCARGVLVREPPLGAPYTFGRPDDYWLFRPTS